MATEGELDVDATLVLNECVAAKFPERQFCRDEVLRELLQASIKCEPELLNQLSFDWNERKGTVNFICENGRVWERVVSLIEELDSSVARYPDDGKSLERWNHQAISRLDEKKETDESASLEQLSKFCRFYRQNSWATSPALDIWLVRQMIFAETFALARELGLPPSTKMIAWTWGKAVIKWLIGLVVALIVGSEHGWPVGALVYIGWLSCIRYLASDKIDELKRQGTVFANMRNCYVLAMRRHPCPSEICDALHRAENNLAVWPDGLRALIEAQLRKSRVSWV